MPRARLRSNTLLITALTKQPKYLIGTEKGSVMLATKKPKKNVEINYNNSYGLEGSGRHMGPVVRVARNPFNPRFFFSIGDWGVHVS